MVVFLFLVCYESDCGFLWCYLKSLCSLLMLGICGSCVVFSMGGSDSDVCIGVGDRRETCGTPYLKGRIFDGMPLKLTSAFLPDR